MRVLVDGSGGSSGWPEPGCRCASCLRAAAAGTARKPSAIVVDGVLELGAGGLAGSGAGAGYRVRRLADARHAGALGGWDVTGPDGGRLLYPAGPGAVPGAMPGAGAYDFAFLDLLGEPAQLGRLRAAGLITPDTVTAVAFADHRVTSARELRRRCAFWRVRLVGDQEEMSHDRSAPIDTVGTAPHRVLVIGGARSGKSEQAELRLAGEPDVTYVATGPDVAGGDAEWAARVAAHRARRPAWWRTAETTDLAGLLASARGALLIDGIGTWLAAVLTECGAWGQGVNAALAGKDAGGTEALDGSGEWHEAVAARIAGLVSAWRQTRARVVAVSDETGLGVVPQTRSGRLFRDQLGRLNQALAAESEETELVVAGRVLPLPAG